MASNNNYYRQTDKISNDKMNKFTSKVKNINTLYYKTCLNYKAIYCSKK